MEKPSSANIEDFDRRLHLFAAMAVFSEAQAQYICGPGSHSTIGGMTVPDASFCAADETDDGEQPNVAPDAETRQPVWETRWGAIATGPGTFGAGLNFADEDSARAQALTECQGLGDRQPCRVRLAFDNQCAVLAAGDDGSIAFGAATVERARALAGTRCSEHTSNCKIIYSGCSLTEQTN